MLTTEKQRQRREQEQIKKWVTYFSLGTSFLVFVAVVWMFYVRALKIAQTPVNSWTEDQAADCAIVLTGGPQRIREGFDLLLRHSVQKLIISGVHPQTELRDIFPTGVFHSGWNEQDVILEKISQSTWGNAKQSLVWAQKLKCQDVILVTSRLHMWRAFETFRVQFPENIRIQKRAVVYGSIQIDPWELFYEVIKSFYYDLWAY